MSTFKVIIALTHMLSFEDGSTRSELIHTYEVNDANALSCLQLAEHEMKKYTAHTGRFDPHFCEVTYVDVDHETGWQVGYYD